MVSKNDIKFMNGSRSQKNKPNNICKTSSTHLLQNPYYKKFIREP